jgi:pimeloyl-ACP methyl ester carboxylesterase
MRVFLRIPARLNRPSEPLLTVLSEALIVATLLLLPACQAPIGATKTSPALVYREMHGDVIRDGNLSDSTRSVLRRIDQEDHYAANPDATLTALHQRALDTRDRDVLFALSELSYLTGEQVRRSVKPWEPRQAQDYYLSAAVYAWFFLFGQPLDSSPSPFDGRFRGACDLYNRGLGWALSPRGSTNAEVQLTGGLRRLAVGQLKITFHEEHSVWAVSNYSRILMADHFQVRGLSVRNRQPGLGAPLIAVTPMDKATISRALPATVVLRLSGELRDLQLEECPAALELYSTFDDAEIEVNGRKVPLQTDTTAPIAYSLNQNSLWTIGRVQFLSSLEQIPTGIYQMAPYAPGKIPVVFVHGTFSSPVWWAELFNTLSADPVLRKRCQFWWFVYNSGNSTVYSANRLREALTDRIEDLDPDHKDPALQQMVVVGHSQGGLLAKLTATDTGDTLWRSLSTNRLERLHLSAEQQRLVRDYLFFKPLPFVKRVVFICTPHRGSYQAGKFVRWLARSLVTLPDTLVTQQKTLLNLASRVDPSKKVDVSLRTSLDSMSPQNPGLLALAEIPLGAGIKGHSIIAVRGDGDFTQGDDGMVRYSSAHLDYVNSECVVRSGHSCLSEPATIEEVRRILRLHVSTLPTPGAGSSTTP